MSNPSLETDGDMQGESGHHHWLHLLSALKQGEKLVFLQNSLQCDFCESIGPQYCTVKRFNTDDENPSFLIASSMGWE